MKVERRAMASKRLYFISLVVFGAFVTIYQLVNNQMNQYLIRAEDCTGSCNSLNGNRELLETLETPTEEPQRHSRLPDIIGIGTEKCGTGALQFYLKHHPLIRGHPIYKETHFFTGKVSDKKPIDLELYKKYLANATDDEYIMEKTPAYFNFRPSADIPGRIKRSVPFVKLWLVLCDPANRVYSDFVHEKNTHVLKQDLNFSTYMPERMRHEERMIGDFNHEDRAMHEYIKGRMQRFYPSHILLTGLYYYHILQWHKYFDKRQLFIVDGEKLIQNPYEEVKKVEEFIGLPSFFKEEHFVVSPETGFYCVQINPTNSSDMSCMTGRKGNTRKKEHLWVENNSTIQQLKEFYKPYNDKLFSYLNRTFSW